MSHSLYTRDRGPRSGAGTVFVAFAATLIAATAIVITSAVPADASVSCSGGGTIIDDSGASVGGSANVTPPDGETSSISVTAAAGLIVSASPMSGGPGPWNVSLTVRQGSAWIGSPHSVTVTETNSSNTFACNISVTIVAPPTTTTITTATTTTTTAPPPPTTAPPPTTTTTKAPEPTTASDVPPWPPPFPEFVNTPIISATSTPTPNNPPPSTTTTTVVAAPVLAAPPTTVTQAAPPQSGGGPSSVWWLAAVTLAVIALSGWLVAQRQTRLGPAARRRSSFGRAAGVRATASRRSARARRLTRPHRSFSEWLATTSLMTRIATRGRRPTTRKTGTGGRSAPPAPPPITPSAAPPAAPAAAAAAAVVADSGPQRTSGADSTGTATKTATRSPSQAKRNQRSRGLLPHVLRNSELMESLRARSEARRVRNRIKTRRDV